MQYQITIKPSAQKDLDKLPVKELLKVASRLKQLENNPRPIGVQKLTDKEGYRIRIGNYRVLFEINDNLGKISIYRIKHRTEAYK